MNGFDLTQNLPRSIGAGKSFKKIGIKQVDSFTETPLAGNPAGVVTNGSGLTDQQMQAIAREMALSETAFVLPPSVPGANIRIRWFTSNAEVDICGHATVAAFHALAEEGSHGMAAAGVFDFVVETRSGLLPVQVIKSYAGIEVQMGLPIPEFERAGQFKLDMVRLLNITAEELDPKLPIVKTDYLYVPVRRLHSIFAINPNYFAMAQLLTNRKLNGICAFTIETIERKSAVHSRFFAPHLGINEDPVTGSANGPLGVYLFEQGEVNPTGDSMTLVGEQGDVMGRKGRVTIHLEFAGKQVSSVKIGGKAVTILDGEMVIG